MSNPNSRYYIIGLICCGFLKSMSNVAVGVKGYLNA